MFVALIQFQYKE